MSYVNKGEYHVSSKLFDEIMGHGKIDFKSMEDEQAIAVFVKLVHDIKLCYALGEYEHTSDWDPYLEVKLSGQDVITTKEHQVIFDISEAESKGYPDRKEDLEIWLEDCKESECECLMVTHKFRLSDVEWVWLLR